MIFVITSCDVIFLMKMVLGEKMRRAYKLFIFCGKTSVCETECTKQIWLTSCSLLTILDKYPTSIPLSLVYKVHWFYVIIISDAIHICRVTSKSGFVPWAPYAASLGQKPAPHDSSRCYTLLEPMETLWNSLFFISVQQKMPVQLRH